MFVASIKGRKGKVEVYNNHFLWEGEGEVGGGGFGAVKTIELDWNLGVNNHP